MTTVLSGRNPAAMPTPVMAQADTYIRQVQKEGERFFAVHGNDGQPLALAQTRELAYEFLRQHELSGGEVH